MNAGKPTDFSFAVSIGQPFSFSVISGNLLAGIHSVNSKVYVQNNLIGPRASFDVSGGLGNGRYGVLLESDTGSTFANNIIAFNGQNAVGDGGIVELGTPAATFSQNRIFLNNGLGIDLGGDGVTPNRPPTPITDPNRFPNYPVITRSTIDTIAEVFVVEGTFVGTENTLTTVEFFLSTEPDPSGFGEGRVFAGSTTFTTDASGRASFSAVFTNDLFRASDLGFVTATATSFATSEFSQAFRATYLVLPELSLSVSFSAPIVPVAANYSYRFYTQNVGKVTAFNVTLADVLPAQVRLTPESADGIRSSGGSITVDASGVQSFALPIGVIGVGGAFQYDILVTANAAGQLLNTATVTSVLNGQTISTEAKTTSQAIYTFTVLNNRNSGFGSLRQAVLNADANPGVDTIDFKLPPDQLTIQPKASLPFITDPTIIDAATQPGFAGAPIVELNGANVAAEVTVTGRSGGLVVTSGGTTIRGLIVSGFAENGIAIYGHSGSRVVGNVTRNNGESGILIQNSLANTIGGTSPSDRNILSANGVLGLEIAGGSSANVILGNYIGTSASGTQPLGNGQNGIFVQNSSDNTIGGVVPGSRNVIAGNGEAEVQIFGPNATRNLVAGNFIGTDVSGSRSIFPNGLAARSDLTVGVFINDAPGNTVGGTSASARNIVGGEAAGVEMFGNGARSNVVIGNFIGTDVNGSQPIANSMGVLIYGAPNNAIFSNVVSGNTQIGVRIDGTASSGNLVAGNIIGLDASGTRRLGNGLNGIFLSNSPANTIGGTTPSDANLISANGEVGIQIFGAPASGNLIVGNIVGDTRNGDSVGNGLVGIFLNNSPRTTVGGLSQGAGNVISGNSQAGIQVSGALAVGEVILGNTIRGAAGTFGISVENSLQNDVRLSGEGANIVSGGATNFLAIPTPGPTVSGVSTQGAGNAIRTVTIAFNEPLNTKRASDRRAYRVDVLNLRGRKIGTVAITSASYDEATSSVTLTLAHQVPSAKSYRVVVIGEGPRGLTNRNGVKLDGKGQGGSGTNYQGKFGTLASRTSAIAKRHIARFGIAR